MTSRIERPVEGDVHVAKMAFNQLVNPANPRSLANPPPEFVALHAVVLCVATAAGIVGT